MAATVTIYEANGGTDGVPGSKTRVDGQNLGNGVDVDVRFCTADAYNDVAAHPCIIPAAGSNFSFWKHLYLNIATGTGFTTVNNIRFYTDGTIGWNCGTGGGLYVGVRDSGDNGAPMDASYEVATGVVGTSGHDIDDAADGHTYYKDQTATPALASDYTSGATLLVDSTDYSAADDSNAIVVNVKLATDATQGTQTAETLTFLYDEI